MGDEVDVTELLDAVIWGRRIIEVSDDTTFVLRPLTLEERNMGNYIYKQSMKKMAADGTLTREQLIKQSIQHGLWKADYSDDLEKLRAEVVVQTKVLEEEEADKMLDSQGKPKRKTPTSKYIKLKGRIDKLTETIRKLEEAYASYIELPSAEHQAECSRGTYFLHCATLSFPSMNPIWPSLQDLKDSTDTVLVLELMRAYYAESIASEAEIRRIARSGFWRCKWMGSKKNRGVKTLFDREMYDLTMDQFQLVYWSQIYDSAYEAMEPPSDEVVDDDKLFDRWLDDQNQKRKQKNKASAFNKKTNHLTRGADGQEVGFDAQGEFCEDCTCGIKDTAAARGYDKRGHVHDPSCSYGVYIYYNNDKRQSKVEEIQSINPLVVRKILGNEQKRLEVAGVEGIKEEHLRGDRTRSALGMGTQYHGSGEAGRGKQGRVRPS